MNGPTTQAPEEERQPRPPDVEEDVRLMAQRKRVSEILNSAAFRRELEQIIDSQIQNGQHPAALIALQQIADLMLLGGVQGGQSGTLGSTGSSHYGTLPRNRVSAPAGVRGISSITKGGASSLVPIDDLRGVEGAARYSPGERQLRCRLAAVYRLVDLHGWTLGIYNHITARVPGETDAFLINPFGMLYHEVSASSLVKISQNGEIVDRGSTLLGINKPGWLIHSAIHSARHDIRCVIHIHSPPVIAVSSLKSGLLPVCEEAIACGKVSYHDYWGIVFQPEEQASLISDLGPENKIMFLRNHGVLCCGETIEEAWYWLYNVVTACETQMMMSCFTADNLVLPESSSGLTAEAGCLAAQAELPPLDGEAGSKKPPRKYGLGELEFEALMRSLDNAGYRTGYSYKQPLVKRGGDALPSDVATPPYIMSHSEGDRAAAEGAALLPYDYSSGRPVKPSAAGTKVTRAGWLEKKDAQARLAQPQPQPSNKNELAEMVKKVREPWEKVAATQNGTVNQGSPTKPK